LLIGQTVSVAMTPGGRQRAVCDRRRILSAELIEDQKTRLFQFYFGARAF
jgi:hypothetical protein